jgi:hypothetical protein
MARGDASGTPWALRCIERFIAIDYASVRANHRVLASLAKCEDVTVFSAHDPVEFDELRGADPPRNHEEARRAG